MGTNRTRNDMDPAAIAIYERMKDTGEPLSATSLILDLRGSQPSIPESALRQAIWALVARGDIGLNRNRDLVLT